jgi:hypothetical protein
MLFTTATAATLHAYDGFQAGAESYGRAEAERQAAVRRQVQLNDLMRWRVGLPPANGVFYAPLPVRPWIAPGYGFSDPYEAWGQVVFPYPGIYADALAYRAVPASRQPVGRIGVQTGPNRWESRPVYAAPIPAPAPSPPIIREVPVHDAPPVGGGPREF